MINFERLRDLSTINIIYLFIMSFFLESSKIKVAIFILLLINITYVYMIKRNK